MKTSLPLALAATAAFLAPVAAAHILVHHPVYDITTVPPTFVRCMLTVLGSESSEPHATSWIQPCPMYLHRPTAPMLP